MIKRPTRDEVVTKAADHANGQSQRFLQADRRTSTGLFCCHATAHPVNVVCKQGASNQFRFRAIFPSAGTQKAIVTGSTGAEGLALAGSKWKQTATEGTRELTLPAAAPRLDNEAMQGKVRCQATSQWRSGRAGDRKDGRCTMAVGRICRTTSHLGPGHIFSFESLSSAGRREIRAPLVVHTPLHPNCFNKNKLVRPGLNRYYWLQLFLDSITKSGQI